MVASIYEDFGKQFVAAIRPTLQVVTPLTRTTSGFIDTATFLSADYKREWLVEGILVAGQPGVVGGPKKILKTSLLVDVAASLASGRQFLGKFVVPKVRRVALMSGESGEATLQETFRRICTAKGIHEPSELPIYWSFRLPRLSDPHALKALGQQISRNRIEVLVIDPIYLCLLSGNSTVQAQNLMQMGPLLADVGQTCADHGATLLLAHHMRKTPGSAKPAGVRRNASMDLDRLAYAGFAEFFRQWLFLDRRTEFQSGSGKHELWLTAEGSAGHSKKWAVDIDEGKLGHDFQGRTWKVRVLSEAELIQKDKQQKDQDRKAKEEASEDAVIQSLLAQLRANPDGATRSDLEELTSLSRGAVKAGLAQLRDRKQIEDCDVVKPGGPGGPYPGVRLRRQPTNKSSWRMTVP